MFANGRRLITSSPLWGDASIAALSCTCAAYFYSRHVRSDTNCRTEACADAATPNTISQATVSAGTFSNLTQGVGTSNSSGNFNDCLNFNSKSELDLGCMPRERAVLTSAIRIPNFLSHDEVKKVCEVSGALESQCGTKQTDSDGVYRAVGTHKWIFLHTDDLFEKNLSWLQQRICKVCRDVDENEKWGLLDGREAFRTAEHHLYTQGGALIDKDHIDTGSLVTIDIMLSQRDKDFYGGDLVVFEKDEEVVPQMDLGDAVVFVSHKPHYVRQVTAGTRKVFVAELWRGEKRTCAHRCDQAFGVCHFTRFVSRCNSMLQGSTDGGVKDLF